jgi:hypothetical protein
MVEAIARLLGESADYTGLVANDFADISEAVDRYLRYQEGPESWLASRFSCPAKRLQDLVKIAQIRELIQPFPVLVTGISTGSRAMWEDELAFAAQRMNELDQSTSDWVEVAGYQILPPGDVSPADALRDLKGFSEVEVYIELGANAEAMLGAIAESEWAMALVVAGKPSPPETANLSLLIHECLSAEAPFKVSAGSIAAMTGAGQYGFINIFGATALALSENLSRREIAAALEDGELSHWSFAPDSVSYRGLTADLEAIDEARTLLVGFDCPSVEKVLDELATIGFAVPREA